MKTLIITSHGETILQKVTNGITSTITRDLEFIDFYNDLGVLIESQQNEIKLMSKEYKQEHEYRLKLEVGIQKLTRVKRAVWKMVYYTTI